MSANMTSFFEELVRAKQAIDELPTVQAKLDAAESEKRFLSERLYDHGTEIDKHKATIEDLRSQISKLEASLDAANKSKGDVDDKLRLLSSVLHSVATDASEAVALIEPKAAEPVVSVQPSPTATADGQETTAATQTARGVNEGTSPSVDPFAGSSEPAEVGQSTSQGQGGGNPTISAGQSVQMTGEGISQSSGQSETNPTAFTQSSAMGATTSIAEVPSNPASGPFASLTEGTSTVAAPSAASTGTITETVQDGSPAPNGDAASLPKPYQGQAYWRKPDSISWESWKAQGGEVAPWYGFTPDLSPI